MHRFELSCGNSLSVSMVLGLLSDAFIVISIFFLHLTQRTCNPPLLLLSLQKKKKRKIGSYLVNFLYQRNPVLFFLIFCRLQIHLKMSLLVKGLFFNFPLCFHQSDYLFNSLRLLFIVVTSLPNLLRLSRMVPFFKAAVDCPYF